MEKEGAKRIVWVDLVRVIALAIAIFGFIIGEFSDAGRLFFCMSAYLIKISAFLITVISGYLFLGRDYKPEDVKGFFLNRWLYLFVAVIFWNGLYHAIAAFNGGEFSVFAFVKKTFFLQSGDVAHLKYLPIVLGYYVAIPFLAMVFSKYPYKIFTFPLILVFVQIIGIPCFNRVMLFFNPEFEEVGISFDLYFYGGIIGIYVILGYILFENKLLEKLNILIILIILVCSLAVGFSFYVKSGFVLNYNWLSPFLVTISLCEIVRRCGKLIKGEKFPAFLEKISKMSFGIFIVHKPVLSILLRILNRLNVGIILAIPALIIAVPLISFLIILLMEKVAFLRKYILFMEKTDK